MKPKKILFVLVACALILGMGLPLYGRYERSRRVDSALPQDVQILLDKGQKFFLYALQPEHLPDTDMQALPNFHGYPIIGQTPVKSTPFRQDLLEAIRSELGSKSAEGCFAPKYGIRVVRNKKTVDLLISFNCEQMQVYDARGMRRISIGGAAQSVFNHILAELDVPLPEK